LSASASSQLPPWPHGWSSGAAFLPYSSPPFSCQLPRACKCHRGTLVKSNPSTHRHASTVNNIHSHSYPTRNHRNKENADPNSVFRNHKLQVCSGLTHGGGVVISILEEAVPGCSLPKLLRDVIPSPNVCLNLMTCPMRVTSFTIYHLKYRFEAFLGFTSLHVFDCETRWGKRCFVAIEG
jgi:hypothetical protein